jgi:DCN1-like protein 4/5
MGKKQKQTPQKSYPAQSKPTENAPSSPTQPTTKFEPYSSKRTLALFKQYTESDDPDVIGPEGYTRLCTDAGIPMEGALPLVLAWIMGAKEMGKLTKAEWVEGTGEFRLVLMALPFGGADCKYFVQDRVTSPDITRHERP